MSALGHKRTLQSTRAMAALPPIVDIDRVKLNVRFGPEADIRTSTLVEPGFTQTIEVVRHRGWSERQIFLDPSQ
jgi:hypothetical protein